MPKLRVAKCYGDDQCDLTVIAPERAPQAVSGLRSQARPVNVVVRLQTGVYC